MGEAKRRRDLYPETFGTKACPGAGIKKIGRRKQAWLDSHGRWLTRGSLVKRLGADLKTLIDVVLNQKPLNLGRNARKRERRAAEKSKRAIRVIERAELREAA